MILIRQMPQELISRDYCKLLYTTRCKPKSINDNKIPAFKLLPEDLAFDSYVQDFFKSHKKDKRLYSHTAREAAEAFQKGSRPEHGESLSTAQKIKNKILNRVETLILNKNGMNKTIKTDDYLTTPDFKDIVL